MLPSYGEVVKLRHVASRACPRASTLVPLWSLDLAAPQMPQGALVSPLTSLLQAEAIRDFLPSSARSLPDLSPSAPLMFIEALIPVKPAVVLFLTEFRLDT